MEAGDHVIVTLGRRRGQGTCIRIWRRDENHQPIMSTSSGPKDNFVNFALALMTEFPGSECVALMSLPDPPFPLMCFLLSTNGTWHDRAGMRPEMEIVP